MTAQYYLRRSLSLGRAFGRPQREAPGLSNLENELDSYIAQGSSAPAANASMLLSKYRRNPLLRYKLLATGDVMLIEFDRGAKRESEAGRPPLWTGMVKDGVLYGQNLMGNMMMEVRDQLAAEAGEA